MIYGYARVSTAMQAHDGNGLEVQREQLKAAGAAEIICEHYTGTTVKRPEFSALLSRLCEGDTLIVCKLDRFARTARDGVETIRELIGRGVSVNVLNMGVVNNTPMGNLMLRVMFAFAEFERDMIVERTQSGIAMAKQNPDYKTGRPRKYGERELERAMFMLDSGVSYTEVTNRTGISRATLTRARAQTRRI